MIFHIYSAFLYLASIFFFPYMAVKFALKGKGRAGLGQRLGFLGKSFDGPGKEGTVWVHAVSVGETLAAAPIVKALSKRRPGLTIYFSTVTETGNAVARENLGGICRIFFFPFDFPFSVGRVVNTLRPDVFVVVETEIWPNALKAVHESGARAVLVNGRISPRSFRGYSRAGFFMRRVLPLIEHFNMQTARDAERITALGAPGDRVSVAGNVKFDQACGNIAGGGPEFTKAMLGIPAGAAVMVAGSTHEGEEQEVLRAYRLLRESFPGSFLIIAPRHPERFRQVEELIKAEKLNYTLKSAFKGETLSAPGVILLDTMGELARVYAVGDINFVGGSWAPVGGHNVLEPASFGKPVFFGPHMHNFQEISRILKDSGAGVEVRDGAHLAEEGTRLLNDPARMRALGNIARDVLMRNRGALMKNVELIERYLDS
jgi:3-deoxy-D-manno-octulosonic-acid transferase